MLFVNGMAAAVAPESICPAIRQLLVGNELLATAAPPPRAPSSASSENESLELAGVCDGDLAALENPGRRQRITSHGRTLPMTILFRRKNSTATASVLHMQGQHRSTQQSESCWLHQQKKYI